MLTLNVLTSWSGTHISFFKKCCYLNGYCRFMCFMFQKLTFVPLVEFFFLFFLQSKFNFLAKQKEQKKSHRNTQEQPRWPRWFRLHFNGTWAALSKKKKQPCSSWAHFYQLSWKVFYLCTQLLKEIVNGFSCAQVSASRLPYVSV